MRQRVINHDHALKNPKGVIHNGIAGKTGYYLFPEGIVSIRVYSFYKLAVKTILTLVCNNRVYVREITPTEFTDIGLARLAGKFAKEHSDVEQVRDTNAFYSKYEDALESSYIESLYSSVHLEDKISTLRRLSIQLGVAAIILFFLLLAGTLIILL